MARTKKEARPAPLRKATSEASTPITARLDGATLARLTAYAERAGARIKLDIGTSTAAAMLIREGLDAVERAESAS